MSYCRWSDEDFQCDVYCYEDVGGYWQTYVAGIRYRLAEPLPAPLEVGIEDPRWPDLYFARHRRVMELVVSAERVPIGLPHDGASFQDASSGECADRLEQLRAAGYRIPQYAIDALRQVRTPEPEATR